MAYQHAIGDATNLRGRYILYEQVLSHLTKYMRTRELMHLLKNFKTYGEGDVT